MNHKKQAYKNQAETIIENLEKRNMDGYYCADGTEAVQLALDLVEEGLTVSFGGSETLKETGILKALKEGNFKVIDRDAAKTLEEKKEIYKQSVCSDYFFMSTNAITLDGELVNIDGSGNRVACLMHGPENVIILAGMNKVTSDTLSSIDRVRNFASPPNAVRLNTDTPCKITGSCKNCLSPDCMCSHIVITRRSKIPGRIKVILIGEEFGY